MKKPPALRAGDRVAVVAPASGFDRGAFDRGIAELRALGFEPVFDDRVFAERHYVAGEPGLRASALLDAWRDPTIRGVIGVRGGYGSVHLLRRLPASALASDPKVFIGHSDLTSLLVYLTGACGVAAIHGPMVVSQLARGEAAYDRRSFLRAIGSAEPLGELAPAGVDTIRSGEAAGPLLGGTLSPLVASLGTAFAFDPPDRFVLFLDEVGERPYRLDRMLTQLDLAGILGRAAALVFGELPRCDEPGGTQTARATVAALLKDFPGPVLFGFPSGHTTGPCWTLPLGVRVRVIASQTPRLVVEEAAVV